MAKKTINWTPIGGHVLTVIHLRGGMAPEVFPFGGPEAEEKVRRKVGWLITSYINDRNCLDDDRTAQLNSLWDDHFFTDRACEMFNGLCPDEDIHVIQSQVL